MSEPYEPGPASGARIDKDGDNWILVVERELRHPPEKVWRALTEPEHLREWSPFDADKNLGAAGATVKLTTVGAPQLHVTETKIVRADAPKELEFSWGDQHLRWQLERTTTGTRLTLRHKIVKAYIAMGAAGWQVSLDVLERALDGKPIGRKVGPDAMALPGFHRLHAEFSKQFGIEMPAWAKG